MTCLGWGIIRIIFYLHFLWRILMKPFRSAFVLLAMLVVGYGSAFSQQFFTLAFDGSDSSQIVNTPGRGSGWAVLF
jgi:hypothetical protein